MVTYKTLFNKFKDDTVLERGKMYALWTIPQLMADMTEAGSRKRVVVERDYQEIGALLVNHLAPKLAKLLFPTNHPFYRIEMSEQLKQVAAQAGVTEADLSQSIARAEMDAVKQLFLNAAYAQLILLLKHLIVTGNALLHRDSAAKTCSVYGLQSYATRRDGKGRCLDCIVREFTFVEALHPDIQELLRGKDKNKYSRPEQEVELYTRIHRKYNEDKEVVYEVSEQVDTIDVGEPSTYPEHLCPWLPVTWSIIVGEHYGRGLVEDFAGGFAKLSDVSEAHALYLVESLRVINLVSASSGSDVDDLANAETGEWLRGDPNTVSAYEAGDYQKSQQASNEIEMIFSRLSKAFMYQANVRNAERVTAYELQRDAEEAENALGGAYSTLSSGIQVPLAHILTVETQGKMLPGLISGDIKLNVTAGIPALGRTTDIQNLMTASQEVATIIPIVQIDKRINPQRVVDMVMSGRSVDTSKLNFTEAEMQQQAAAEAQQTQGMQQLQAAEQAATQLGTMEGV